MFGAIKKFFRRQAQAEPENVFAAGAVTATEETQDNAATAAAAGDAIVVSVSSILTGLPKELQGSATPAKLRNAKLFISRKQVLEQLAHGSVKVPFLQVRRAAPTGVFTGTAHDEKLVDLPMGEIFSQLKPEEFARRPGQKKVVTPTGFDDLFGSKGEKLAKVRVLQKADAPAAPAAPAAPVAKEQPARVAATPAPAVAQAPAAPVSFKPQPQTIQAPSLKPAPKATPAPAISSPALAALQSKTAPQPQAKSAPAKSTTPLRVAVQQICTNWPADVRQTLETEKLLASFCILPVDEVSSALKQGKVHFTWRQIYAWLQPAGKHQPQSPAAEQVLELPLAVIAPLFVASSAAAAKPQKKLACDEQIPDLFKRGGEADEKGQPGWVPAQGAATSAPATPAPAAAPAAPSGSLTLSLALVSTQWPDLVRNDITAHELLQAKIEVPCEEIEEGLKAGKLQFRWKQVCAWITPPPEKPVETKLDCVLEFPLSIVVPLYLQARPSGAVRKQAVPANIPDMFGPNAASPARPGEQGKAAAPAAPTKQAQNIAELFGEPDKKNWTPNEIVQKTCQIAGVDGALIALQDGLLVASLMPPHWKTETIAAFLPQIFGRMGQYSKELSMGELRSVCFSVEQGALQIFNAGIIYFAALGRPGESLPIHELNLIATELSRHTK